MAPAMTRLQLREWEPAEVTLRPEQAAELLALEDARLEVAVTARPGVFRVTPGSVVGIVRSDSVEVLIRPKIGVERLFELLSYSRAMSFSAETAGVDPEADIVESFAAAYLAAAGRVLSRGPLQGYVSREEALSTFRGRLRAGDQVRRHFGLPLPVETTYDDFTVDIDENRLLKAAFLRLDRLPIRRARLRRGISEALSALAEVSDSRYSPRRLPEIALTRLNRHYQTPIELAKLILRNSSVELRAGRATIGQFLVNMNDLFEEFVYAAIGRRLPPGPLWVRGKPLFLDAGRRVRMEPDLSWWQGGRCIFVGDAKYKRTGSGENHDLYQLLAYCIATGRSQGLLLYAEAAGPVAHIVEEDGVSLRVEGVDLGAPLPKLEARIDEIAALVTQMAGRPEKLRRLSSVA
jgi:5-methylcytosine-specific restriction enzyme subunit McrC